MVQSPQSAEDPNDCYFSLISNIIILCVWMFYQRVYCVLPMYNAQGVQKMSALLELKFQGVLGIKPRSPKTAARVTAGPPLQSASMGLVLTLKLFNLFETGETF